MIVRYTGTLQGSKRVLAATGRVALVSEHVVLATDAAQRALDCRRELSACIVWLLYSLHTRALAAKQLQHATWAPVQKARREGSRTGRRSNINSYFDAEVEVGASSETLKAKARRQQMQIRPSYQ
eukprot:6194690-Pleurochrysis_carterae.AAC.2